MISLLTLLIFPIPSYSGYVFKGRELIEEDLVFPAEEPLVAVTMIGSDVIPYLVQNR